MTTTLPPTATTAARVVGAMKIYGQGPTAVHALDGVDVDFERAKYTAIMGPSGSGKSTLLHCVAGLDRLTSGEAWIGAIALSQLSEKELTKVRRDHIGFIFQTFNLIPTLTAAENITLPMALAHREPDQEWVDKVIDIVRLRDRLSHRPSELSGGQQQRVAVARALASRPDIVFADEPTGNLDSKASVQILAFMQQAVREFEQTIVMVTHDPNAASYADRVVFLQDGKIVGSRELLDRQPVIQRSIKLRNPYVDPMNAIQVELLRRFRHPDTSQADRDALRRPLLRSVTGIAAALRNTG